MWTVARFQEALLTEPAYRDRFSLRSMEYRGQGEYGTVFTTHDHDRRCRVGLKVGNNHDVALRFEIEREALFKLTGAEHVITLYEYGTVDRFPLLVLEYADNDLRTRIEKGLDPEEVGPLIRQICYGFEEIHGKGVYHRDLKPENVLFVGDVVKLSDFGEAKVNNSLFLSSGGRRGSPLFLAPEVLREPSRSNSPEAEMYMLGCLVYEMYQGVPLFSGDETVTESAETGWTTVIESLIQTKEDAPYIESRAEGLPVQAKRGILAAIAPGFRCHSPQEFLDYFAPENSPTARIDSLLAVPQDQILGITLPDTARELVALASDLDPGYMLGEIETRRKEDRKQMRRFAPAGRGQSRKQRNARALRAYLKEQGKESEEQYEAARRTLQETAEAWGL